MSLILSRIAVIAVALVIWFWTQKLIARKSGETSGIGESTRTAAWEERRSTIGWIGVMMGVLFLSMPGSAFLPQPHPLPHSDPWANTAV